MISQSGVHQDHMDQSSINNPRNSRNLRAKTDLDAIYSFSHTHCWKSKALVINGSDTGLGNAHD